MVKFIPLISVLMGFVTFAVAMFLWSLIAGLIVSGIELVFLGLLVGVALNGDKR
ncbi:DUF1056 domain-containing protein [Weissella confusa]|uniref:DUF1056 domain-containing protein n=1 Tax=Weissella confusa TaxID=1583 RepID=UPI00223AA9F2|nr:DUF1056 domain-containing protein [Weissella confusa]MCT0040323.1 DUF1056 domain-containing protein [Weissella confusa]